MFIETAETPNPATLKFIPGVTVMETGTAEFEDTKSAESSPLATKLFNINGVTRVFYGKDFISVTKSNDYDWPALKTQILASIMDHFTMGGVLFHPGKAPDPEDKPSKNLDDEISNQIVELLETRVRPAVAQDGGDIEFYDYDDGIVYLRRRGACAGCPSSILTLKSGIENMLKHFLPEVQEVRSIE